VLAGVWHRNGKTGECWLASLPSQQQRGGRRTTRTFSVQAHGFQAAKEMAEGARMAAHDAGAGGGRR
jgi:hypothetical protein